MSPADFDNRFFRAALDGLKEYRRTEFTVRFLKQEHLPVDPTLDQMWSRIQKWMGTDPIRCKVLWEYVDDLRLWGRQRVFLYRVDEGYAEELRAPDRLPEAVRALKDKPDYTWEAADPFLAKVTYSVSPDTGAPLLVFKLIENRRFGLTRDDQIPPFEERSTNFFIINLQTLQAELRVQELETGAERDVLEERDRLMAELKEKGIALRRFQPIELVPVMEAIVRQPPYTVTSTRFKFTDGEGDPDAPGLLGFLNNLFRKTTPIAMSAFWEVDQDILGLCPIYFRLSGASNWVAFGGLADPLRVSQILATLGSLPVSSNGNGPPPDDGPPLWRRGGIDSIMAELEGQPQAQAVVLSMGAVAASILWILIEAIGGHFYDELLAWALQGLPVSFIKVPAEIAWIIFYYGWDRVSLGFRVLGSLSRWEVWRAINEARKRRKGRGGGIIPDDLGPGPGVEPRVIGPSD